MTKAKVEQVETFFEGTGVTVEDCDPNAGYLVLTTGGSDGRDRALIIKINRGRLSVEVERR